MLDIQILRFSSNAWAELFRGLHEKVVGFEVNAELTPCFCSSLL